MITEILKNLSDAYKIAECFDSVPDLSKIDEVLESIDFGNSIEELTNILDEYCGYSPRDLINLIIREIDK